ncbi:MAG TPA: DUF5916 domain-containing protein [Vicinamibacterales bacterium]|nr:DUF5916 domain-containing protein [Vicinamibacterales bacterium]
MADAVAVDQATAIKLDGELTDEVWSRAPRIDAFLQSDPKEGAAPSFPTEARVAYDATHIYVAVSATDPEPDKIVGHLTRRDTDSPSDWIAVAIDSYHDKRSAYEFSVNPAGVKQDRYYYNDSSDDRGWDAVWDVAVSRHASGWRAEFRIPFSQLRFPKAEKATFGLAIVRRVGRLNETSTWPLIAKSVTGFVSQFGDLGGLALTRAPKRLELLPYTVSELKTKPESDNPLIDTTDPDLSFGVDMKYALTPGLTLTSTVNPDFGQVEADPAVVNLSAFETFFSERRPFFVEGSGVYQFGSDCGDSCLFYSRRIGRRPQLSPDVPEDGFVASPENTTILGATKVTGRVGGFSIGVLNALTSRESATLSVGGLDSSASIEPFTSYTVGRLRRELKNQSSFGMMMTATNRNVGDELSPLRLLAGSAYTGGADWDIRLRNNRYAIAGYVAGSSINGTPAAILRLQENNVHSYQRPDADHVELDPARTSLSGAAGSLAARKIGGERVRFESNVNFVSPGYDTNDVGFMRRADLVSQNNWIQWRHERPGKRVRSFRFNLNQWSGYNFDGDQLNLGGNVNAHWTFTNNWSTGAGVTWQGDAFDDRATRGGPGARNDAIWVMWHYLNSDDRKPIAFEMFTGVGQSEFGPHFIDLNPGVTFRPRSALSVSGGLRFGTSDNDAQWVTNEDVDGRTHYVFARIDQQTVALTLRANYTMSPTLSLQLYAEPFVSAGAYTDYKELIDGRSKDWRTRYAPYNYGSSADFNYRSFRTTNVLRWEYRPGSALFVVWQQGREDTDPVGRFRFGRDFRGVFTAPASNVFLVKMSYWLNY